MKFIGGSYSLYAKDIQQTRCRSEKFSWKSKFCLGSGSGSGSWYYFGFQYQTYISYIEDTHQMLFGSANSFESYCVHMKSPRKYSQTTRRTGGNFFWLVLSSKTYTSWTFVKRRQFFLHSCDYNTFSFYMLRMWWESEKIWNRSLGIFPRLLPGTWSDELTHWYYSKLILTVIIIITSNTKV